MCAKKKKKKAFKSILLHYCGGFDEVTSLMQQSYRDHIFRAKQLGTVLLLQLLLGLKVDGRVLEASTNTATLHAYQETRIYTGIKATSSSYVTTFGHTPVRLCVLNMSS